MKIFYSPHFLVGFLGLIWLNDFATAAEKKLEGPTFEIGPAPNWVKPITPPHESEAKVDFTDAIRLLADWQQDFQQHAYYFHEVIKITSSEGVRKAAPIGIYFHPDYEKLTLNKFQITRDGVASNRLDGSHIKLSPYERDPLRAMYERVYGADVKLDDVQPGDTIEFACTVQGQNPRKGNHCSQAFPLQWGTPVIRNVVRLRYPANRKVFVKVRNAKEPTITTANGITELFYDARDVPGRKIDDDIPADYTPTPRLQISDFQNWAEVAQWALPLFDTKAPRSSEFNSELNKLRAIPDPEQRVLTALQFVQEEIRFVNVKTWVGDNALADPDEVLRRKFADSKEKVVLFVTLLRQAGIDATPALVADDYRGHVPEQLPSTDVFDHAIVQVHLGQNTYWLDPRRTVQRGPLSHLFVGRYRYALLLRPETSDIVAFEPPKEALPVKKVVETYRVSKPENDSELEVISEYRGVAADDMREYFRDNNRDELQKRYLEYYTRHFPGVKPLKTLWYEEVPGEDACRLTESYNLGKMWVLSEGKDRYTASFTPGDIYSALGTTISTQRQDPFRIEYPNTVTDQINIEMFEDWPLDSKANKITTDFFEVTDEPESRGAHIQLNYSYKALKDRVEVGEIAKFNEAVEKAKDSLGYTLTYRTPEQIERNRKSAGFNWSVAAGALVLFIAVTFIAYRYFRDTKLVNPLPPPIDAPARLNGIGGWLILLAIGQLLRPISYIKVGFDLYTTMLNLDSWESLTDPTATNYHPWWAPTLLFELFYNISAFVLCVLLIALFFTKRSVWPRCFAVFLILTIIATALDSFFIDQIPAAAESIFVTVRDIGGVVVAAAIWIPYLYLSKRVKATFRY